ncbi:hypothetical protein J2S43_001098 [Catenuloplanes nepalensis]|uniref:Uncharacterized protein n=1 Tax=Catenuloplanes nepalensis TaxID=587533 RepID=A0ABT9MMM8_9ACTN|nr:hypothetical protein [Catenuloplanes nepalensis]MDP9792586.1 hypothetical protein [Catenuloplanes nepalensis]
MSAWIVSRDHLDLLLSAALAWELTVPEQADATGRTLWKENLVSVAYRYPADRDGTRPGPADFRDHHVNTYRFARYPGRADPEVVAAAAASLAYQSCEHPEWPESAACRWVTNLREQASQRVPAYVAAHGPVDPTRQKTGEHGWHMLIDLDKTRHVHSVDGWAVPDRNVFIRAAELRTPPTKP